MSGQGYHNYILGRLPKLKAGQKILRINATSVKGMDRNAFRDLLSGLTAGAVVIDVFELIIHAVNANAAGALVDCVSVR